MKRDKEADAIKVFALVTAVPRWAGALLEADGVPALAAWDLWWRWGALVLSIGMAVVEGFALAYVLSRWRRERENGAHLLFVLALVALVDFAMILAPYVAANVSGAELRTVLGSGVLLWAWSIAVAASTGIVVASVGYAQRTSEAQSDTERSAEQDSAPDESHECPDCHRIFKNANALRAHSRFCKGAPEAHANGKEPVPEREPSAR